MYPRHAWALFTPQLAVDLNGSYHWEVIDYSVQLDPGYVHI
jgi:hypothetical protein